MKELQDLAGRVKRRLNVRLASPRGFCAGVERAIRTVEEALARYGAPVYVRHEIVHNAHVVNRLRAMGAVFIEEVGEAPADRPLIFSAHGAPQAAHDAAQARAMTMIDATCPLVQKVHSETRRHVQRGRHVILVGHAGHPEVEGTMGQVAPGAVTLVQSLEEARRLRPPAGPLAYVTQTTLSVDDTMEIVAVLKARFPEIEGPKKADICYATSNRQAAVKKIAPGADLFLVIGSPNSSNSRRLVDTAVAGGARRAALIEGPESCDLDDLDGVRVLGVSAGASAPENLVEALLDRLARHFDLSVETVETAEEDIVFKTPMLMAG
ncbi:MAG: 4-hydroxy-3-methylbut-2-enyl diphosphate reductase [Alphaproteobacteria bacterium]|nr:4-hydroxy-3-methylbut-2-enyl diphosphate reductase [Alphaproteobacteria bacterium]